MAHIKTLEMRIRKLGKQAWNHHFQEQAYDEDKIQNWIDRLIREHPRMDRFGTFKLVIRVNGGYGKNHETGATIESTMKFPFRKLTGMTDRIPRTTNPLEWNDLWKDIFVVLNSRLLEET